MENTSISQEEYENLINREKKVKNEIFNMRVKLATEPTEEVVRIETLRKIDVLTKEWKNIKLNITKYNFDNNERGKKL